MLGNCRYAGDDTPVQDELGKRRMDADQRTSTETRSSLASIEADES
jgi:hypothetical protein